MGLTYKRVGQYYNDNGSLKLQDQRDRYSVSGRSGHHDQPLRPHERVCELHNQERFTVARDQDPTGRQQPGQQSQYRRSHSGDCRHRYRALCAEPGRSPELAARGAASRHHHRRLRAAKVIAGSVKPPAARPPTAPALPAAALRDTKEGQTIPIGLPVRVSRKVARHDNSS